MSGRLRVLVLAAFVVGITTWSIQAQTSTRTKIDLSNLGPQVGERVPDFSLQDQNGKTWTRQSILGPKGAMLVFVRSAEW